MKTKLIVEVDCSGGVWCRNEAGVNCRGVYADFRKNPAEWRCALYDEVLTRDFEKELLRCPECILGEVE